jgi:DNA end-binding protein Ku
VVITPEELEALDPKKTRTIDIEDFVDLDEIDPLYYEHPYYLAPDTGAAKAYKLLLTALQESKKVAIARVVIRSKEYLTAIRPADGVLTMETMLFSDELVPPDELDELPDEDVKATAREVEMAKQLIDSLTTDFDPTRYQDEYRERVLDLIERKAEGEEITIEPVSEEPAKVPDLMAALEASLAATKKPAARKSDGARAKAAASKDGAPKRSSARKGATAKRTPAKKKREKAKARS